MSASANAKKADGPTATARRRTPGTEKRTVRALAEPLAVVEEAPDLFTVYSVEGTRYTVDAGTESCSCPDMQYNQLENGCKHVRVVRFWMGREEIPSFVNRDGLGFHLRYHLEAEGRL